LPPFLLAIWGSGIGSSYTGIREFSKKRKDSQTTAASGGKVWMDSVRAFDIPVDDMGRAKRFYERVFGWKIQAIPGSGGNFHAAYTAPVDEKDEPLVTGAINGGLFLRGTDGLKEMFLEVTVPSIDEYLKRIESEGGQLVKQKGPILDIAFFAVIRDTEGNLVGLWEDVKK
jgi:predicted enzyme related to lactoylglutathione lyase